MASSAPFDNTIDQAAINNGLSPDYLRGLLKRESGFNPSIVNTSSGAQGLGQVLPSTAANPGYGLAPLTNPFDPTANINFSAAYLAARIKASGGSLSAGTTGYSGNEYSSSGVTPLGRADGSSSIDAFAGVGTTSQTVGDNVPGMGTQAGGGMTAAPDNPEFPGVNLPGSTPPPAATLTPQGNPAAPLTTALSGASFHDWFRRIGIGILALIMLTVAFAALASPAALKLYQKVKP